MNTKKSGARSQKPEGKARTPGIVILCARGIPEDSMAIGFSQSSSSDSWLLASGFCFF